MTDQKIYKTLIAARFLLRKWLILILKQLITPSTREKIMGRSVDAQLGILETDYIPWFLQKRKMVFESLALEKPINER